MRKGAGNPGPCLVMDGRALLLREGFIRISLQLDGLPNENFLDVIGVIGVVLAFGFVLGYMYANYANKVRMLVMTRARRSVGTQSVGGNS